MSKFLDLIPVYDKLAICYSIDKTILTLTSDTKHLLTNAIFPPNLKCVNFEYSINFLDFIKINLPSSVYSLQFNADCDESIINNLSENIEILIFLQLNFQIQNLSIHVKKIVILCDTLYAVQTNIKKIPFGCVVTDGNGKIYFE